MKYAAICCLLVSTVAVSMGDVISANGLPPEVTRATRIPRPQSSTKRSEEKLTPRDPMINSRIFMKGTWAHTLPPFLITNPFALLAQIEAKPGHQQLCATLRDQQRYRVVIRKHHVVRDRQLLLHLRRLQFVPPADPVVLFGSGWLSPDSFRDWVSEKTNRQGRLFCIITR